MQMSSYAEQRESGRPRRAIERAVRDGELRTVHKGVYIAGEGTVDEAWRAELLAHLHRGGDGAAVSHRAAARLWGFDGQWDRFVEITVPWASGFHGPTAIRSRTIGQSDITLVDGLAVTTKARTLEDLGRFASTDQCELAHQSAVRGGDPRRPDLWDEDLHAELVRRASCLAPRPGLPTLRRVLRRHGNGRPTGSPAETRAVQVLRGAKIELDRQVLVRFVDRLGRRIASFWVDLGRLIRGLIVEIDGAAAHSGAAALARDLQRQNLLTEVFEVVRFTGSTPDRDPEYLRNEVRRRLANAAELPPEFTKMGWLVRIDASGAYIQIPR